MSGLEGRSCPQGGPALHALADGELDALHASSLEQHLGQCEECSGELNAIRSTRDLLRHDGVRWRVPEHVRAQMLDALSVEARSARPSLSRSWVVRVYEIAGRWGLVPSAAALAAALFLTFGTSRNEITLERELVTNHVRSLLADHLTDVTTSDQHTVKPWFTGKIDFSLPVVDLNGQGFPLVGGRVDYLAGRVVAALAYRRRGHVINLFVWPDGADPQQAASRDGFGLLSWSASGLRFVAVSDVSEAELERFREAFKALVSSHENPE